MMDKSRLSSVTKTLATELASSATMRVSSNPEITSLGLCLSLKYLFSLNDLFKSVKSKYLVVSFTSDWRFPPKRSRELVKLLLDNEKNVSYSEINSEGGHDAFLMDNKDYFEVMKSFIDEANNGI